MRLLPLAVAVALLAPGTLAQTTLELLEPVVMRGAAVAETPDGLVGTTATFTITLAKNGSGHIFLDTFPLSQVDMQGSARLAARVAAQVTGRSLAEHDLFFVIRSGSTQIGGPSAGATLAVGAIAALMGWKVRSDVLMTGTIHPDGSIGPVGGVPEKAAAAADAGMRVFLFPEGEEVQPLSTLPGAIVRMDEYCRDELGIWCIAVSDIYQAVENMTDHAFVRPPVVGDVTGASFKAKLGPLSAELLAGARRLVDEATAEVGRVPPGNARLVLQQELSSASDSLRSAENASANGTYYTAASLSFQASIAARDARDRARLVMASDASAVLDAVLADTRRVVEAASATVGAAAVRDTSAFESVGAAQVRAMEAEDRLALATSLVENGTDTSRALYEAAYAYERATTATWWLKLGEDTPSGKPVEPRALTGAAQDAITTSSEMIAYVEAVFGPRTVAAALSTARERLASAERAAERGFAAAAILHALEAEVRASDTLLLASFGRVPEERIEQTRLAAARAIQEARGRGAEPILAESEYEFGLSLADPIEKQTFLGVARVTANLAGLPTLFGATPGVVASRFLGTAPPVGVPPTWVAASFAVGLALGVGTGLAALLPRPERRRVEPVAEPPLAVEAWRPP